MGISTESGIHLRCGCFTGDVAALRKYIAEGDVNLRRTRTLALDTVLTLLAAKNGPEEAPEPKPKTRKRKAIRQGAA